MGERLGHTQSCVESLPYSVSILSCFDALKLLGDDGQNLNINPVELIKATPGPRLTYPREKSTHHLCKHEIMCLVYTEDIY